MINKLKELLEAATPGPWIYDGFAVHDQDNEVYVTPNPILSENTRLIAAMRNELPELLDRLEFLERFYEEQTK